MKKHISILCIAAMLAAVLLSVNSFAAGTVTFTLSSDTSPARPGDTITISVKVSGVASTGGLALAGPITLKYETAKLSFVSAGRGAGIPETDVMTNHKSGEALLDYLDSQNGSNPLKKDATLFLVKFKVKQDAPIGTTSFSLEIPDGAVGDKNMQTVTAKKSGLTLLLSTPRSDNANLSALAVSNANISPAFSSGVTRYTASVPFETANLLLSPVVADPNASFKVSGNTLKEGETTDVKITVTAENGNTKVYTIAVARAEDPNAPTTTEPPQSADSSLQSLKVDGFLLSPEFKQDKTDYVVWVPFETKEVKITAEPSDTDSTVTVTGGNNLVTGKNTVSVVCKAADGSTRTYTITVRRAPIHGLEDVGSTQAESTTKKVTATTAPQSDEAEPGGMKGWLVAVIALATLLAGCAGGVFLGPILIQNRKF